MMMRRDMTLPKTTTWEGRLSARMHSTQVPARLCALMCPCPLIARCPRMAAVETGLAFLVFT